MKRKEDKVTILIGVILCILPIIVGGVYDNRLSNSLIIQFGVDGNVYRYAPKWLVLYGIPIVFCLLHLLICKVLNKSIVQKNAARSIRKIGQWIIPLVSILVLPMMIYKNLYPENEFTERMITIFVGSVLMISGNYFPKNRNNPFTGMKFPWLLKDKVSWNKTHKLAAYLWIVAGFFLILQSFLQLHKFISHVVVTVMVLILPTIYSLFLVYQQKNKLKGEIK